MDFKKIAIAVMAISLVASAMCSCGKSADDAADKNDGNKNEVSVEKESDVKNAAEDEATNDAESEEAEEEIDDGSPEGYITSRSKFEKRSAKLLDLSLYNNIGVNEVYDDYKTYSYSMPNAKKTKLSYTTSFETGADIKIPAKFKDIIESGWECEYDVDDRKLRKNTYNELAMFNEDGEKVTITIINKEDAEISYLDADVIAVKVEPKYYNGSDLKTYANCPAFTLDGKINKDATIEDVIDKFGQPLYFSASVKFDKEGNYTYTLVRIYYNMAHMSFYGDTGIIFEFSGDENKMLYAKYMYDED